MNLYLAGFRGAGKSTVGSLVASQLGLPFVDLDRLIEARAGQSIAAIFREQGQSHFRRLESEALLDVASGEARVVALGGGCCLAPQNRTTIRKTGRCVWLTADWKTLQDRILADPASADSRPSLTGLDPHDEIQSLLAARHDGYAECAELVVETAAVEPGELAARVCHWWLEGR